MANHKYTLSDLSSAITHALGGAVSSGTSATHIANDALQYLADYHPWLWRRKALSLNFTISQSFIAMPSDFESLLTAKRNTTLESLNPVTLDTIHALRANGALSPVVNVCYAMSYTAQANATSEGTWRMEIYPTPTANATAAIIGTYLRIIPALSSSSDVPDIPAPWHPALKSLCRAMAVSDQFQEENPDWMRAKSALDALVLRDGEVQPSLGRLSGAVSQMRGWDMDIDRRDLRGSITTP